jgi:hypothetical protein
MDRFATNYEVTLNTKEKNVIVEYVEGLENEILACIRVANGHGWHGGRPYKNGKPSKDLISLDVFFGRKCEELVQTEVDMQMLMAETGEEF